MKLTLNSKNIDATEGVIWKKMMALFLPTLIGTLFQQLYNTADTVIVGRFVGKEALAAIGNTGVISQLVVGFFTGLSAGATILVSQCFGMKNAQRLKDSTYSAVCFSLIGGAVISLGGFFCTDPLLSWISVKPEYYEAARTYLRIYLGGSIFLIVYNMGTGILRAVGDTARPLYYLIATTFVNIALDLLFVGAFRWGVAGAAYATVLSELISAALVLGTLHRERSREYGVDLGHLYQRRSVIGRIFTIGLPSAFNGSMYSISNMIIMRVMNSFNNTSIVAAHTAADKANDLFWLFSSALNTAVLTFSGQNYGAGKRDRLRKGMRQSLAIGVGITVCISAILYLFAPQIIRLFTQDPEVIEQGVWLMRYIDPFDVLYIAIPVINGIIRGSGDSFLPMLLSLGGICGIRLLWVALYMPLHNDMQSLMICYPLSWGISSVLYILYYYFGNWFGRSAKKHAKA